MRSGLLHAPRVLNTVGLAAGTFEIGWKIGDGINAKFLRIGLPDPPAPKSGPSSGSLKFFPAGTFTGLNSSPLPEAGWVLRYPYSGQTWHVVNLSGGWSHPCAYLTGPPFGFRVLPGTATNWCDPVAPVESYWLKEHELGASGPIEPYVAQPYSKYHGTPTSPPQQDVEDAVDDELSSAENSALRQGLNYQLGSPGETDPLGVGDQNPDIEFPTFFPHWEDHGDEFAVPYEDPLEYWRDAADIVERGEAGDPDILRCVR